MRTGAIFARGSCRALKWMALLGVAFALGVGSVAAQTNAALVSGSEAEFTPHGNTLTLNVNTVVTGAPDNADFKVQVTPSADGTTAAAQPSTAFAANVDVTGVRVTGRKVIVTVGGDNFGTLSAVRFTYTQPSEESKQITPTDGGTALATIAAASPQAASETDSIPVFGDLTAHNRTVVVGMDIAPFTLPEAMGGNGALTYGLIDVAADSTVIPPIPELPPGLTFTAASRTVSGKPTETGEHTLRYTAAESGTPPGNGDVARGSIMFTVEDTGFTPTDDVEVEVKSVTAAASVDEGGSLEVTVTATVPAGEEVGGKVAPIASRMVMVSFPATIGAKIMAGEDAEAEDFQLLGADGDGYYMWEKIPRTDKKSEQTFKFRVEIRRDVDAEDEKFQIEVQIGSTDAVKTKDVLMIDDAQTQTYKLSLPTAAKGAITEGAEDATKLTLKADPERTMDIEVALAVSPNDPTKYVLGDLSSSMFGMGANATVTSSIRALADKNRSEDAITVTAYTTGSLGNNAALATLDITVKDANALPGIRATVVDEDGEALATQPDSVMEGETLMVKLTAVDKDGDSMKAAEKLMVSLVPAGTAGVQDYRLLGHPVEIASGKESSDAVDLMILADDDVGEEMLVFDAVVSGDEKVGPGTNTVMGVLSLMIEDGTMKLVWAKSMEDVQKSIYDAKEKGEGADKIFSPGEMIEVDASTLFNYAEGVTLNYVASSDAAAVKAATSGSMVTVTAAEAGMANVTITAHANAPAGVKIVPQGEPDEASVMFPLEVGLEALSIMLSGPEDMNVAEGMSAEVTATANRAVTADTTVMLMRDRSMSSAGDDDFMAEAITIKAGEMMGTTMVMAVEDNMAEDMEELVLYGMTEGMAGEVTGEVHLHIWDAAVPALPIIAQLLLAAFLAIGGYRRYLRR